jgi:hypothetical protein
MAVPETKTVHSNKSGTNWYKSENSTGKNTWTNITSDWNINDNDRFYKTTGSGKRYYLNRSDPTLYKTTWEATNGLTKKERTAQSEFNLGSESTPAKTGIKRTFLCNCDGPVCTCQLDLSNVVGVTPNIDSNLAPSAPSTNGYSANNLRKRKRSRRRSTRRRRNTRSRQ